MNTSPTQISENIKTHGRDFANIFPYLMSPTSINHIFLLPGDVNHLCDIEHLDAVVDERLGITGQLGVQEKTEKVEGRLTREVGARVSKKQERVEKRCMYLGSIAV